MQDKYDPEDSVSLINDEISETKTYTASYRKKKKLILFGLLFFSAVFGVALLFITEDSPIAQVTEWFFSLLFLFLILGWCHYDALDKGYRISKHMRVFLVLFYPLAFPIYLFKSRGLGGFKSLMFAILYAGLMVFTSVFAGLSVYGIGRLLGREFSINLQ
jgi:hypothetical protein